MADDQVGLKASVCANGCDNNAGDEFLSSPCGLWRSLHSNKCTHKMEDDEFQLRFSFKFEGTSEVFFAFAIPFSYDDTQV